MIKYDGSIVQFGFGAVGKSFFENVSKEIKYNENKYFVIERYAEEFDAYINLGGMASGFISCEITKDNFNMIFEKYLSSGDILIDFADTVSSTDLCDWCAERNIMYINTGNADWPEKWPNIYEQNKLLNDLKEKHQKNETTNRHPIVLQHGNNPGLVSHFVKAGIEFIVNTQHKRDRKLKTQIKENKFSEAAQALGIKMIHVNDIDLQQLKPPTDNESEATNNILYNTWCIDTFLFELLTEATFSIGTHENYEFNDECKQIDRDRGFVELKTLSADKTARTYYPGGVFEGFLVTHEETATIAKSLEVRQNGKTIYRPTVMFIYKPCASAANYLKEAKVNNYPNPDPDKPQDCENEKGNTIIRGYKYPQDARIAYGDKISSGTEFVGVLLIGDIFQPVWIGNRVELPYLYRDKKTTYWQTPTITPVAISALAAICWMINNKDTKGIFFPEDIIDYKYILKLAEKHISKTIYKSFCASVAESMSQTALMPAAATAAAATSAGASASERA